MLLFALCGQGVQAQTTTASPYSAFGLGEVDRSGTSKSKILAGTGIGLKSEGYLNSINPASLSAIDSAKFIFEMGLESSVTYYSSYDLELRNATTSFNYLGLGFQVTNNWKSSVGIKPYSHVGYNITMQKYITGTTSTYNTYFTGSGDLSQIYWANAFVPIKNLSLGANLSYLFGPLEAEERVDIPFSDEEEVLTRKKHLSSFYADFGLQYTIEGKKLDYTVGAIYGPGKDMNSTYTLTVYNSFDTLQSESLKDVSTYSLPVNYGLGVSLTNKKKTFSLAADYKMEEWDYVELEQTGASLQNSYRYSMSFELMPRKSIRDPYIRKINYMLGWYYNQSNINFKGTSIDKKGFTVGLGLPLRKEGSYINVGFEMGRSGTIQDGLIQEDYYKAHLSFSLKDNWFQKTRYR